MATKAFLRTTTAVLLLLAGALPLSGGPSPPEQWAMHLKEVGQKLRAQQWEEAEKQVLRVADQIVERTGTGQGAAYFLAVASALQAIAESGLRREEEADWHWDMALNLFPDIAKTDLSPYSPSADRFKTRQLRSADPDRTSPQAVEAAKQDAIKKDIQPPRIIRQARPKFPEGLRQMGVSGNLAVETIIDRDGVPRQPLVLSTQGVGPAMKYAALEALRQWRFEPARLEGEPVKVYYVLTINFINKPR
ncbi:MAG TPA: energy transducer TonB [Thermoanaerobaculia bacterium]